MRQSRDLNSRKALPPQERRPQLTMELCGQELAADCREGKKVRPAIVDLILPRCL